MHVLKEKRLQILKIRCYRAQYVLAVKTYMDLMMKKQVLLQCQQIFIFQKILKIPPPMSIDINQHFGQKLMRLKKLGKLIMRQWKT